MSLSLLRAGAVSVLVLSFAATALAQTVLCDRWEQQRAWSKIIQPTNQDLYGVQQSELRQVFNRGLDVTKTFKMLNDRLLDGLKNAPASICAKRAPVMELDEAMQVYRDAYTHPVASLNVIHKYDLKGGIGFCFGRAMTTQNLSNQRGLAPDSVLKIWAVGRMVTSSITWGFHVTTIVRGPIVNGATVWYAIDPIFARPMPVDDWVNVQMKSFNSHGEVRFFVTPSEKFGPNVGRYQKYALEDGFYNSYFDDWMSFNTALTRQCYSPADSGLELSPQACMPVASWPDDYVFKYDKKAVAALAHRASLGERGINRGLSYQPFVKLHPEDRREYSDLFREIVGWKKVVSPGRGVEIRR